MKTQAQLLIEFLLQRDISIALAESVTCGFAAHSLGNVQGTSKVFKGSIVCYDESVKHELLGIKTSVLKKFTAESAEVTDALATNLGNLMNADIHAAVTGLAAPGGSETTAKPVGTVFFAVVYKKKLYRLKKLFKGTPLQIKDKAAQHLFKFVRTTIRKAD